MLLTLVWVTVALILVVLAGPPAVRAIQQRIGGATTGFATSAPPESVRPLLASALGGPADAAAAAMMTIARHADICAPAFLVMMARARDAVDETRFAALTAVRALGASHPGIREACWRDDSAEVRRALIASIGGSPPTGDAASAFRTVSALLEAAIADIDAGVRREACRHLDVLGGKRAIELAAPLLTDPDDDVHREACVLLGRLADRAAVPMLAEQLSEADNTRLPAVLSAMVHAGRRTPEPLVRLALGSGPVKLRTAALRALGAIGLPGTAESIAPLLHDDVRAVRRGAADAIAGIAHVSPVALHAAKVVDALVTQLGHESAGSVTRALIEAIHASRDPRARDALRAKLPALNAGLRERALEVMAALDGAPAAAPAVPQATP